MLQRLVAKTGTRRSDPSTPSQAKDWRHPTMRGSITKRRGDSWTTVVDMPPDPTTGKRRQKRVTARTKREVEAQAAELIQKANTGFVDAGKVTVREYFNHWLETTAPTLRA